MSVDLPLVGCLLLRGNSSFPYVDRLLTLILAVLASVLPDLPLVLIVPPPVQLPGVVHGVGGGSDLKVDLALLGVPVGVHALHSATTFGDRHFLPLN